MASGPELLAGYVTAWSEAVDAVLALLRSLDEQEWARSTDLPGWDVRAVAAHLAHVEADLAGLAEPPQTVADPTAGPTRTVATDYTEAGVRARAIHSPAEIVDELERAAAARLDQLRAAPPEDPAARPDRTPGGVGWDWATLLSNRVIDVWVHDQDIRRAVDRPGEWDTAAARHTLKMFGRGFLFSVGKRVAPPEGTTVVLEVTGADPVHLPVVIANGRAVPASTDPDQPDAHLGMDRETFLVLAGGRRRPDQVQVEVTGDQELAGRILAAMAITP